jgi:alkylation response protein AidB-like acyl-CoA dehydrogenase
MYMTTTAGAGLLVRAFGSQKMRDTYAEKLFTGEWGGTMALTEPDAGSSLGDMITSAVKADDGDHYLIKGTKCFISSGDHDLAPNIVHPVLAKIEGAPPGTKGISMFIVPKYRQGADGAFDVPNDVATTGVEHKLGLRGQATATLSFGEEGDCHGWLVGEENMGLKYMFLLLNHARLHTGVQATAGASAAYQCALQYSHERIQGRDLLNATDPTSPQVPIIKHPDVRHMLLQQKATVEGNIALMMTCSRLTDTIHVLKKSEEHAEDVQHAQALLEILTPCCKAFGSDSSFESIRLAIQCLGGAGFCEDYPVAQLLRDNKVFSIYEGTNGIQSLDLLGRKIPAKNGASMQALMQEIGTAISNTMKVDDLRDLAESVQELQNEVVATTMQLGGLGMSGEIPAYLCNATAYLEMFSQLVISWQWLIQATRAHELMDSGPEDPSFYKGLVETGRYYIKWTVPKALATAQIIKSDERTALNLPPECLGEVDAAV